MWISADIEVRGHEGGCTGAGYPEGGHSLAAQELSDAGAKHLPAIAISEKNENVFVTQICLIFNSDEPLSRTGCKLLVLEIG